MRGSPARRAPQRGPGRSPPLHPTRMPRGARRCATAGTRAIGIEKKIPSGRLNQVKTHVASAARAQATQIQAPRTINNHDQSHSSQLGTSFITSDCSREPPTSGSAPAMRPAIAAATAHSSHANAIVASTAPSRAAPAAAPRASPAVAAAAAATAPRTSSARGGAYPGAPQSTQCAHASSAAKSPS